MKILKLKSENFKKLSAVEITPDGNVIVIGGKNGAGKSSVIDSIWSAMGGKGAAPSDPIRHGQKGAEVSLTIGNGAFKLQVTRTWTEKGSHLTVRNPEGTAIKSPQSILDALYGRLTFDPLAFAGMDGKGQIEILKQLTGLDLEGIEAEREAAYAHRTEVGRELRQAEANLKAAPYHENMPEEQATISVLLEARKDAQKKLDDISETEHRLRSLEVNVESLRKAITSQEREIGELKVKLVKAEKPDVEKYDDQIRDAEAAAQKRRDNTYHGELAKRYSNLKNLHDGLNTEITGLDDRKREMVENSDMPVKGLELGDEAVMYQGVPLDQSSSAERLRVSVAIGLAMNPRLKVLLIRDGSLLDEDNLAMIAEMAEKADAQLWIERVGEGAECSVILEDGHIARGTPATEAANA